MNSPQMKTILLVEDDQIVAKVEEYQLQNAGYSVLRAFDSDHALQMAFDQNVSFDLILMDIDLGNDIDGIQVAQQILQKIDIPIIFLSSHTEAEIVNKAGAITSYGYVIKNTGNVVLEVAIETAFRLFNALREQKLADEALKHSNETLKKSQKILSILNDCIVLASKAGEVDTILNDILEKSFLLLECDAGWINLFESTNDTINTRVVCAKNVNRDLIDSYNAMQTTQPPYSRIFENSSVSNTNFDEYFLTIKTKIRDHQTLLCVPFLSKDRIMGSLNIIHTVEDLISGELFTALYTLSRQVGVLIDRLAIESKLKNTANNLNILFNTIDEMVFILSPDGSIIQINDTVERKLGYSHKELTHQYLQSHYDTSANTNREFETDYYSNRLLRTKSGKLIAVESKTTGGSWNGKSILINVSRDISEHRNIQKEIEQSEARFTRIFISSPVPISISDIDSGIYIDVNPQFCSLVKLGYEEIIGKTSDELGIWQSDKSRNFWIEKIQNEGSLKNVEIKIRPKRGDTRDVLWSTEIIMLQSRNVLLSLFNDITDSKRNEIILRENAENYREIINAMQDTVWVIDLEGTIVDVNNSAINSLGYTKEEFQTIGLEGIDALHDKEGIMQYVKTMPADKIQTFETSHKRKDGKVFPVEICSSLVFYQGKKSILSIARDISKRKERENKIEMLLQEKEVILKEVHHRIRNNMNILFTLLSLEAENQREKNVKSILMASAGRIQSMQVLYDRLYCSDNTVVLSTKDYFPALVNRIIAIFPQKAAIQSEFAIDDITLTSRLLTPLGIIINELVTNSLKYAFSGMKEGSISLEIKKSDNNEINVYYHDNGKGFDHSKTHKTPSNDISRGFGLQIIDLLVRQINGTLMTEGGKGTYVRIVAPLQ